MSDEWKDVPSGGLELDDAAHDDPDRALQEALDQDQNDRILGAYRLATVQDRVPELSQAQALKLARHLEDKEMFLDAARLYRRGAEMDTKHPEAVEALFRCACLLLGPARRPEPGADLLLYLTGNFPGHRLAPKAEEIFELHQAEDREGLNRALQEAGVNPPEEAIRPPVLKAQKPLPETHTRFAEMRHRLAPLIRTDGYRKWSRIFVIVYLGVLAIFVGGWIMHDSLILIDDIAPEALEPPRQEPVEEGKSRWMENDGYRVNLTPRYDYTISGLIVSKDDYKMSGLSRGNLYMTDLCIIWGTNLARGVHRQPSTSFFHRRNTCYSKIKRPYFIKGDELSNNHLFMTDEKLLDQVDALERGDQIRIEGQLVDVLYQPASSGVGTRPQKLSSSTTRTDKGNGACEIIYVTKLDVLDTGNFFFDLLYGISFWLLLILSLVLAARLVLLPVGREV
jgi:hypothetical protein